MSFLLKPEGSGWELQGCLQGCCRYNTMLFVDYWLIIHALPVDVLALEKRMVLS